MTWICSCGWRGLPLQQMTVAASGSLCCPECGGSGGLVSELEKVEDEPKEIDDDRP